MERQEAKRLFQPWFDKMTDLLLRDFTEKLFEQLPDYWFIKPASSTGKYHPAFAQDDGGLVRHTLAMLKIYDILWRGFDKEFEPEMYDFGVIACIFHDALKYGNEETFPTGLSFTTKGHELDAAIWITRSWREYDAYACENGCDIDETYNEVIAHIASAIEHHMGPWSKTGGPESFFDKLIFIADYVASSKWFEEDIFNVVV